MSTTTRFSPFFVAIAMVVGFFSYYSALSQHVSFNGGPDEEAHYHAARFIATNGRLAVYPDDEAKLYFPPAGVTLSFRPPFAYLVSIATSPLSAAMGIEEKVEFRAGAALCAALAVALMYLAIRAMTQSTWLALLGALSFGLLPQFAFLASYFNDDPGAMMVVALLLYCIALLVTRPAGKGLLVFTGVALGLVVLSKPTAWVVSAGLSLSVIYLVVRANGSRWPKLLLVAAVALTVGGWWIAFNVFHHGIEDPLNFGVERYLMEKYRTAPTGEGLSYADQGIGVWQLLANHDNFLVRTYTSAVGNLDWLRREMGPLQYGFYGALLVIGIAGSIARLLGRDTRPPIKVLHFTFLLSVALQIASYLWVSMFREVQVQGRYILTILPVVVLMACCAVRAIETWLRRFVLVGGGPGPVLKKSFITLMVGLPVYVHLQGLVHYAIPFYKFDFYHGLTSADFEPWRLEPEAARQLQSLTLKKVNGGAVQLVSDGYDPWVVFGGTRAAPFSNGVMLRVTLESDANGFFTVYWDDGQGMSEQSSVSRHYNIGHQTIHLRLPTRGTKYVRLDPMNRPGQLLIHQVALASLPGENLTITGFFSYLMRRFLP